MDQAVVPPSQKPPTVIPNNGEKKDIKPPPKILLPRINWSGTQKLLKDLEQKLGMRVIVYYTSSNYSMRSQHADPFFEILRQIGNTENLAIIVVSPGGNASASLRMAALLREYSKTLHVLVPSMCASAATILALAGDKIIMSPAGYLTAIDSSIVSPLGPKGADNRPVSVSIEQVKRIIKFLDTEGLARDQDGSMVGSYRTIFKYIHPVLIGEIDRMSYASELTAIKIMQMHPQSFENEQKIQEIAKALVNNYPYHAFPILYSEAKELGLPVEKATRETAELMWDLVKLYDIASRQVSTVIAPELMHFEENPVALETVGQRIIYRVSYRRRQIGVKAQVENNLTNWYRITAGETPEMPNKITLLDISYEPLKESVNPPVIPTQPLQPPGSQEQT